MAQMNALARTLIEKAGYEHGWENVLESHADAVVLGSARHGARVRITKGAGAAGWRLEVPAGLIRAELSRSIPDVSKADGSFVAADIDGLARLLRRVAELAQSLPNQAARTYADRLKKALSDTEASRTEVERLVKQRVGQDTFREAMMDYWGGACAVTGIAIPEVLRASHAKPWADCATDEERLDVFNGFLLTANLDALFDRGLITFSDSGIVQMSSRLQARERSALQLTAEIRLRWCAPHHLPYLVWHRDNVFKKS